MTAGPRAARLSTHIQDREVTAVGKAKPQVIDDDEQQRVFDRVAAVDVAKATGMVCVRLPRQDGSRYSKVWEVTATMGAVTELGPAADERQDRDGDAGG